MVHGLETLKKINKKGAKVPCGLNVFVSLPKRKDIRKRLQNAEPKADEIRWLGIAA